MAGHDLRQQLLVLYLENPDLASKVIGFTRYDGAGDDSTLTGDSDTPPYETAVHAMRDGWRVIQLAQPTTPERGAEYDTGYLRWEIVLEKLVQVPR
jgi:hypothetical protein